MGRYISEIATMTVSEYRHWVGIGLGLNPGTLIYFIAHRSYVVFQRYYFLVKC